jgi:hypothetical protein
MAATSGWKLLPAYTVDPETAVWRHRDAPWDGPSLEDVTYVGGTMVYPHDFLTEGPDRLPAYMAEARRLFSGTPVAPQGEPMSLPASAEALRWFPLPHEVADS